MPACIASVNSLECVDLIMNEASLVDAIPKGVVGFISSFGLRSDTFRFGTCAMPFTIKCLCTLKNDISSQLFI